MGVQRSARFLLLVLLVGSCSSERSNRALEPEETALLQMAWAEVVVDEDGLWVATNGERQLLANDGKYYEARVSPDGRFIVADIAVFSNLQVTRLFRRSESSGSWQPVVGVSEAAWKAAAQAYEFAVEDVDSARTRFVAWSEDGTAFELEVSGTLPGGGELRHSHLVRLGVE